MSRSLTAPVPLGELLLQLLSTSPLNIRGSWHHYRCISCDDQSGHMGINVENGAVKCVRCGFSSRVPVEGDAIRPRSFTGYKPPIDMDALYSYHCGTDTDRKIRQYVESRGVPTSGQNYGWAVGRGELYGKLVLPQYDAQGRVVAAQYRSIDTKRYRSMFKREPRLDFGPQWMDVPRRSLILVEGPFDCLRVRHIMQRWVSALCGSTLHPAVLRDINECEGLDTIVVMLDRESTAARAAIGAGLRALTRTHVQDIRVCRYDSLDGRDPATMSRSEMWMALSGTARMGSRSSET